MNVRKRKSFAHWTVLLLVLGIAIGMAGCSKKAVKASSPDTVASVSSTSGGNEESRGASLGSTTEAGGSAAARRGMIGGDGEIGEVEIQITGDDRGPASRGGDDERIFIGAKGARASHGKSASDPSDGIEHVPEPLIFAAIQPELMVPSLTRGTEPHAPSVASAATATFFVQEGFENIYFDFDRWAIPKPMQSRLSDHAQWLKAHPGSEVVIEGHCDVRGSREYNMVLGEKRARSVKGFLLDLGVKEDQLLMISYGKERLTCFERQESCHGDNRRAHLMLR